MTAGLGCAAVDYGPRIEVVTRSTDPIGERHTAVHGNVVSMGDDAIDRVSVDGTDVVGLDVDPETRCAHYATERDVLAIAFPCCETFYPCHECHAEVADHEAEVWPRSSRGAEAVLCGACGGRLSIEAYLDSPLVCPECGAAFNPGCRDHHDRYFET